MKQKGEKSNWDINSEGRRWFPWLSSGLRELDTEADHVALWSPALPKI